MEWFYQVRNDASGKNIESLRWDVYSENKSALLKEQETPAANWKSCGPVNQGGRMISFAFDPLNDNILWAGSATGGLWRTTDQGTTWTAMTDDIPSLAIGAIGINPQNNAIMLIGTGEGYLLSQYFEYGTGVLKSVDGGVTWLQTGLVFPDSTEFASLGLAWDPVNTQNVYLASTYGIYASHDAGDTWTMQLDGTGTAILVNPQNPAIVYAAIQEYGASVGGIYRSTNHGDTWELLTTGLPASGQYGFTSLSLCRSFPDVIFAGIAKPFSDANVGTLRGIYKSSNGGNTWTQLPETVDFYCYPPPNNDICQGWYDNIIQVMPNDTNIIFSGGIYLYKSNDGGQTWNYSDWVPISDDGYMHPDQHSFAVDPFFDNVLFAFNDGGIYRSQNGGTSWAIKNNNLVTTQFYFGTSDPSNPELSIGGTQDNGIWVNYATDTSTTWDQFVPGDGFQCAIDPTNPDVLYGTEYFSGRMKSTDAGTNYEEINNGISGSSYFVIPLVINPSDGNILFTSTDNNIYRSVNGGEDWSAVSTAHYILTLAVDPVNPDIVYGATDPYFDFIHIYRSMDGGDTWEEVSAPGNKITDIVCDPVDEAVVYATRSKYTAGENIWKSTDYGMTWTNISSDFPGIPVNSLAVDPHNTNHIYAGTDLGVYLSVDGGNAWNSFNDNLPNVIVTDIHYNTGDNSIRAATHGRGFWMTPAANPDDNPGVDTSSSSFSVYPNPVSSETNISFSLQDASNVNICVLNVVGQKVVQICDQEFSAGQYHIQWSGENAAGINVAAGNYYIRMIAAQKVQTAKVTVVH